MPTPYAYNVYIGKRLVDTVFTSYNETAEDVRRSLVNHDGYDPRIRVVKARRRRVKSNPTPRYKARMAQSYRPANSHVGVSPHDVRELELYIDNDLSSQRHLEAIIQNVGRKMASGRFDWRKVAKLFGYLVDGAAAKYDREHGSGRGSVSGVFDKPTRDRVARSLAAYESRRVRRGEWDILLGRTTGMKKYGPAAWRRRAR